MSRMETTTASPDDLRYMDLALRWAGEALAAGEFPVGCVIADHSGPVAEGCRAHSRGAANELDHAEIVALRGLLTERPDIAREGLTVYSTMEPCLMCFATLLLNGIQRIVYAYEDAMGGGTGLDLSGLPPLYRQMQFTVLPGVRRAESLALFKQFFADPANNYWQGSLLAEYTLGQEL